MISEDRPGLTPKQRRRFYEPLIIFEALSEACQSEFPTLDSSQRNRSPLKSIERDRFDTFVYKLAYICAFNVGPDTVTSVAVLQSDRTGEIKLVFGANQITQAEGLKIEKHIRGVLYETTRMNELGQFGKPTIRRKILRLILGWNRGRIKSYLKRISECLARCLKHTIDHKGAGIKAMLDTLRACLCDSLFEGKADDVQYMQACVEAISAINKLTPSNFQGILERAKGHMAGTPVSEAWSDLLHCISRLKAYDQAVDALVGAEREWPEIFQTDKLVIQHIPSSKEWPNPLGRKSMDVGNCIGRMTSDKSIMKLYRDFGAKLQKFELDKRIKAQCLKNSFRPVVHSEVLVYDWIMTRGAETAFEYFKGWKYIGSSKPTCKLCDYFFEAAGGDIGRRPCHGNVYVNWRFPDGYGASAIGKRSSVYTLMNNRIRDDAFKTLEDKAGTGKPHDSDTYSCWTMRQTEAGSTQVGDGDDRLAQVTGLVNGLTLDSDHGSVRGEASDQEEDTYTVELAIEGLYLNKLSSAHGEGFVA